MFSISVAEQHHFYAVAAPGNTLMLKRLLLNHIHTTKTFFKRRKLKDWVIFFFDFLVRNLLCNVHGKNKKLLHFVTFLNICQCCTLSSEEELNRRLQQNATAPGGSGSATLFFTGVNRCATNRVNKRTLIEFTAELSCLGIR
jgi:hypothetical protein